MPNYDSPRGKYAPSDADVTDGDVRYYGFVAKDNTWYIRKDDLTTDKRTYRYARGEKNYEGSWSQRIHLTYSHFHKLQW